MHVSVCKLAPKLREESRKEGKRKGQGRKGETWGNHIWKRTLQVRTSKATGHQQLTQGGTAPWPFALQARCSEFWAPSICLVCAPH